MGAAAERTARRAGIGLLAVAAGAVLSAGCATVGQHGDTSFVPQVTEPAYPAGDGPVVCIDEGHRNFHTMEGRYRAFAEVLRDDGFAVRSVATRFDEPSLEDCDVLVVANALSPENEKHWKLPASSAFDDAEIELVTRWVRDGGSLLLVADHMPFPGCAAGLAAAFGILFGNGFAVDAGGSPGRLVFTREDGSLGDHPITRGRNEEEQIDSVMTFTGQAFRVEPGVDVDPLLVLSAGSVLLLPETAWEFSERTAEVSAAGMLQGAAASVGQGRLAVFGEAAMFTAQVVGKDAVPVGMNVPEASRNAQFLLNVMHWLSGEPEIGSWSDSGTR